MADEEVGTREGLVAATSLALTANWKEGTTADPCFTLHWYDRYLHVRYTRPPPR